MSCTILLLLSCLSVAGSSHWVQEGGLNEAGALIQAEVSVIRNLQPQKSDGPEDKLHPHLRALKMNANKVRDYQVLGLSFVANFCAVVVCILFFTIASRFYPIVYRNNAREVDEGGLNTAPFLPDDGAFGWAISAWQLTHDQMKNSVGVDMMMLIEFANFSLRLLLWIGIPLVCILCPVHLFCGTEPVDHLSKLGMGHLARGSNVFWVHIVATWYVILITEHQLHNVMHKFLEIRVHWLLDLVPPRSTSVLVEGIPEHRQSEAEMKEYFEMLFPGCIESVYLVKKTGRLKKILSNLENMKMRLEQANEDWQEVGYDPEKRPIIEPRWFSTLCGAIYRCTDKIQFYEDKINQLTDEAEKERKRILEASQDPMVIEEDIFGHEVKRPSDKAKSVNTEAGFVTFTSEREARLMLGMRCTASFEEWISCVPPSYEDVIYEDLQGTVQSMKLSHTIGYAFVVGIFFTFLPLIGSAGTLSNMDFINKHISSRWQADVAMIFEGLIAQLLLTLFTGFLPTLLMLVLKTFFVLRANAWAQLKLQVWLFWFNFIFVVLVTALEGSLVRTFRDIINSPFDLLEKLASNLPGFTHFYLGFMCMQWVVHILNLTRYIQLLKYRFFSWMTGSMERAIRLTEPEDQDYYGIGNRSAQWTVVLIIGILFCTLCPLITIFTWTAFVIIRCVYGYLIVFAEIRKPDLGGPFFVMQLWHVQYGLLAYTLLMLGVIMDKSGGDALMILATVPTVAYVGYGFYHFHTNYQWESLPFEELCTEEAVEDAMEEMVQYRAQGDNRPRYRQEELYPDMMCVSTGELSESDRLELRKNTRKAFEEFNRGLRSRATPAAPMSRSSSESEHDSIRRERKSSKDLAREIRKMHVHKKVLPMHKRERHLFDHIGKMGQQVIGGLKDKLDVGQPKATSQPCSSDSEGPDESVGPKLSARTENPMASQRGPLTPVAKTPTTPS